MAKMEDAMTNESVCWEFDYCSFEDGNMYIFEISLSPFSLSLPPSLKRACLSASLPRLCRFWNVDKWFIFT